MIRTLMAFACLLLAACASFDHPIVAETGPALDPALVGSWLGKNDEGEALKLRVQAVDDAGLGNCTFSEEDGAVETVPLKLITARLESRSYLSVQPLVDNEEKAWMLYAYELAGPDRLLVRNAKLDFWKRAVRDKIVGGEITKSAGSESVRVTASGEELRKVVLGYGAVLFEDEVAIEFHRDLKTKPAR